MEINLTLWPQENIITSDLINNLHSTRWKQPNEIWQVGQKKTCPNCVWRLKAWLLLRWIRPGMRARVRLCVCTSIVSVVVVRERQTRPKEVVVRKIGKAAQPNANEPVLVLHSISVWMCRPYSATITTFKDTQHTDCSNLSWQNLSFQFRHDRFRKIKINYIFCTAMPHSNTVLHF